MSIQERLSQIQREGEGLVNRIDQKRKLAELKNQLAQSSGIGKGRQIERLRGILVDTGLVDMLVEAVDLIPKVDVICTDSSNPVPDPNGDWAIHMQWDQKGDVSAGITESWKEFELYVQQDKMFVYSRLYELPVNNQHISYRYQMIKEEYFKDSLESEQWGNKERLESSIADALWKADIRPNEAERGRLL